MGVYAIAGGKGGVGKSTTTASLGIALYDAGFDVALVDADLSMPNLGNLFDVERAAGVHHVLADRASVRDVLVEVWDGLYVVPGDESVDLVRAADPSNLPRVTRPLADAVDVVLLDTGAGLGHETLVATGLADVALPVTTPEEAALADVAKTVEFVAHADATVPGAVVTRTDEETAVGDVAARLGVPILGAIPDDPSVETDPATTGPAGAAYRRLAATLTAGPGPDDGSVHAPAAVHWPTARGADGREPTHEESGCEPSETSSAGLASVQGLARSCGHLF